MDIKSETVCIRCGKKRIFLKKWSEKVDGKGTLLTYTQTICPDKECQEIVDAKFTEMRERREMSEEKRKHNLINRKLKHQTAK